jgi:hypothetical protein
MKDYRSSAEPRATAARSLAIAVSKDPSTVTVELRLALDAIWDARAIASNWLSLESVLVTILDSIVLTPDQKVAWSQEAIDAHLRRGHFRQCRIWRKVTDIKS